jgi:hypothetical protein
MAVSVEKKLKARVAALTQKIKSTLTDLETHYSTCLQFAELNATSSHEFRNAKAIEIAIVKRTLYLETDKGPKSNEKWQSASTQL